MLLPPEPWRRARLPAWCEAARTNPESRIPNPGCSGNHEHGFVEFHRLAVLDQDGADGPRDLGLNRVEHFHRLDDAQGVALVDLLADADEGRLVRRRRGVIGADHGRT